MTKRVRVQLFGFQNRGIDVDSEATEGAVLGEDLRWPDGSLVTPQTIINQTTIVQGDSGGVGTIASTLWELILNIPAFIQALVALATSTTGIIVKGAGDTALTRSIVGTVGEIEVADGDAVAADPVISLGPWPTVKNSIETGEEYTVPNGHQLLVFDSFVYDGGNLILDGDLVVIS